MGIKYSLIVAIGKHREMGADNDLLWQLAKRYVNFLRKRQRVTLL